MKLSLKTVAVALDLPVSTVERWIRQGRIPVQRIGDDAVFTHDTLQKWAAAHHLPFSLDNGQADTPPAAETMDALVEAMRRSRVCYNLSGQDVPSVLKSAVHCIDGLTAPRRGELLAKLIEREELGSTGIGNGIAIPHPREPLSPPPAESLITTCFLETPIDFRAIDDQPVFVLFLLLSPTVRHHLHLLSRLSFCIRDKDFVAFLKRRPDEAALLARIEAAEAKLDAL